MPDEEQNLITEKFKEIPLAGKNAANEYQCLIS